MTCSTDAASLLAGGLLSVALTLFAACGNGSDDGARGGAGPGGSDAAGGGGGGDAGDASVSDAGTGQPAAPVCVAPSTSPPAGSPVIFMAPSPVEPGQVALLFGGHVGAGAQVQGARLDDGNPGLPPRPADCLPPSAVPLEVLQSSATSAKAVLPSSWTAGLYTLVVQNAAGQGAPVVLNRPRVDWVRGGPGGPLVSGGTVDVYGRSFGAAPSAWLVSTSGVVTALSSAISSAAPDAGAASDGYAATFTVPTLAAGAYDLYVHSGQGGPAGFSDPLAVTVAAAATPWPTTVYPVAAGSGNDDTALATAITAATKGGGGIITLATGSYTLTHGVVIPPKTVLRSASGVRTDVTVVFKEPESPAFPYGFAGDADFTVESITVTSSTSARLFQCPDGPNFLRDPQTGGPQYQPDAPCQNATLHDVVMTLTTLRSIVENGTPTSNPSSTDMVVVNGNDCEISDSLLTNTNGSALSLAKGNRFNLLRNSLLSGTTRVSPTASEPLDSADDAVGGGALLFSMQTSAIVGNTVGSAPGLGAGATMGIEYTAHDLYIAGNTFGPNLTDYGEGFSFDAPYYPSFIGVPTAQAARVVTIPTVLNAAGNSVFQGPLDGKWIAASTTTPALVAQPLLVGSSLVVVNGTGLGEYAEIVANTATASDGTTALTLDRDLPLPLDATSVVAVTTLKSQVVFARNVFRDVGVGAQLYAGGYDFLLDGNSGQSLEGTYCNASDFVSTRGTPDDVQRRFSACFFNQWIHTAMTDQVDASYPWAQAPGRGLFTPYANGLVGITLGVGKGPLLPPQRGLGAVGNIFRDNRVEDFSYGLIYAGGNGPLPSPVPTVGQDNVIEQNQTQGVANGVVVLQQFADTLLRQDTCAPGCTTAVDDQSDAGDGG